MSPALIRPVVVVFVSVSSGVWTVSEALLDPAPLTTLFTRLVNELSRVLPIRFRGTAPLVVLSMIALNSTTANSASASPSLFVRLPRLKKMSRPLV